MMKSPSDLRSPLQPPRPAPEPTHAAATVGDYLSALGDLMAVFTWYRNRHPEAQPPADLLENGNAHEAGARAYAAFTSTSPSIKMLEAALTDLYWVWKWYRDEFMDENPPERLVKFNGTSDVAGRAFRLITWPGNVRP